MAQHAIDMPRVTERTAVRLDRKMWDTLISGAGAVVAVVLLALGAAAVYGGGFALDNVKDRLAPQNITFPAAAEMTSEEKAEVGEFAGVRVDTGTEAEAFSRYIGIHLQEISGGKSYAELGGPLFALEAQIEEAKEAGKNTSAMEAELAGLQGQRDTVFKGETLRGILLNAFAWGTVGTITLYAGYGLMVAGLILAALAILGFRHARKTA